jgi:hypothetical protein
MGSQPGLVSQRHRHVMKARQESATRLVLDTSMPLRNVAAGSVETILSKAVVACFMLCLATLSRKDFIVPNNQEHWRRLHLRNGFSCVLKIEFGHQEP